MPVSYDNFVKKPGAQIEYTFEMIQTIEACADDFYHFCNYVKVVHPDKGKMAFEPRWYQKDILNKILDNRNFVGLAARQVGKTTIIAVYILWYCLFNPHKTIGIVSNKEKSAKDILKRIKGIYEDLPVWLKPGVEIYNITNILFDNGTEIMVSATSPDAFRGRTLNVLFCDEIAFVPTNIADEFWAANYPTISASNTSKIIVISTPKGMYNLFHVLYSGAEQGRNGFAWCRHDYKVIPGRDEKWVNNQISILGETRFNQEHGCQFLGSANSVIDTLTLEWLLTQDKDPIKYELDGHLRIYEKPIDNAKYVIGVDSGKGTGEHYSTIQVLKITSINPFKAEQVAVFQDNTTDIYTFGDIIYKIALYYNNAYLIIENNAEGSTIVNKIWWEYEYENLINESSKSTGLGVRATNKTKPQAVLSMKKLLENKDLILSDGPTIHELATFVESKNGTFKGKSGNFDDLVSALYWACHIIQFDVFDENMSINTNIDDEGWGILVNSDLNEDDDKNWLTE